jgi:hypothetical protein
MTMRPTAGWLIATMIVLGAAHGAAAQPVHRAFPGDTPGPPIYANISDGFLPHTDDLAVVFFYRSPACVPADFNLLDYLDFTPAFQGGPPRPFLCELQIEGSALWHSLDDPAPALQFLHGQGAVPTWFVAWPELEAAAADGVLTISELAALPSLQVGEAVSFLETIRNGVPPQRGGSEEVVATGALIDGRSFVVHINEKFRDGVHLFRNIRIDIE